MIFTTEKSPSEATYSADHPTLLTTLHLVKFLLLKQCTYFVVEEQHPPDFSPCNYSVDSLLCMDGIDSWMGLSY